MIRTGASRIVATMAYIHTRGNRTVMDLPGDNVSRYQFRLVTRSGIHAAIAVLVFACGPIPTWTEVRIHQLSLPANFPPKTLLQRPTRFSFIMTRRHWSILQEKMSQRTMNASLWKVPMHLILAVQQLARKTGN